MTDESVNMFGTRQMGRVLIDVAAIRSEPDVVKKIFRDIIVVNTILNKETDIIECLGIGDCFDNLKDRELIPIYNTQIHHDGEITFIRTTFKRNVLESVKDEIMKTIIEQNINIEDFKEYIRKYTEATDEDFEEYDETFLEALNIYLERTRTKTT